MTSRNISNSPVANGRTRVHVVPTDDGWQVRREGAVRATGVYRSQAEATEAAQSVLRRSYAEARIQDRKGRALRGLATPESEAWAGYFSSP